MPQYICSENNYYFREIGEKKMAGDTVTLTEAQYLSYQMRHKGLLRPVDAESSVQAVSEPKVVLKTKKPRVSKKK